MEFTARMIADLLGGEIEGNENITISTFAKIEEGHKGALSFLANPKYTNHLYDTESDIVLIRKDFVAEKPVKTTLIRVEDPYVAISKLMEVVNSILNPHPTGVEEPCYVHESVTVPEGAYIGAFSYLGRGVSLGENVKIYPQVYIGDGVTLGDDTVVYPGVRIYKNVKIGRGCIIHSGAVIGADGFGFAPLPDGSYNKIPQLGNVVIDDFVEIGANTTIDRATMGSTRIGKGTKLDNLIQVAHNVTIGRDTVMAAQCGIAGSTKIGDNCMFAGQVGSAGHIHIGNNVTVGAQSGIPNNVPDGSRIMGYPAGPAANFARQAALLRRLPDICERLAALEKTIKK